MGLNKSSDWSTLTSVVTYSKEWRRRYLAKQYFTIDPVLRYGRDASSPFDWGSLEVGDADVAEFFADADRHNVGRNGFSIPVRSRKSTRAMVSFTNNLSRDDWELFKIENIMTLTHLSALIDAAASIVIKLPDAPKTNLPLREEQCLMWAARGKMYEEIGQILNLSFHSVRNHLDIARHKLHGTNLTHAVAVAVAVGVIPEIALRDSYS